jgi:hypothetical protein
LLYNYTVLIAYVTIEGDGNMLKNDDYMEGSSDGSNLKFAFTDPTKLRVTPDRKTGSPTEIRNRYPLKISLQCYR